MEAIDRWDRRRRAKASRKQKVVEHVGNPPPCATARVDDKEIAALETIMVYAPNNAYRGKHTRLKMTTPVLADILIGAMAAIATVARRGGGRAATHTCRCAGRCRRNPADATR